GTRKNIMDIAVIGMSGAFPKAKNLEAFWQNIVEQKDCISEIPAPRWSMEGFYDPKPGRRGNPIASGWACWKTSINSIRCFLIFRLLKRSTWTLSTVFCCKKAGVALKMQGTTRKPFPGDSAVYLSAAQRMAIAAGSTRMN